MQKVQRWSQPCCTCEEGAGAAVEAGDQMPARRLAAMMSATWTRGAAAGQPAQVSGRSFSALPTTRSTSGMAAIAPGADLRGAAGDDDARAGMLAPRAADRLARLALGLGGDGAGVDDHRVASAAARGVAAHHLVRRR